VTASVHGAWVRRSVAIDGGEHFETQRVVWLQAGPCYADMRVPFHPAAVQRCFVGRSGWDGDRYRWTHWLDLEGADSPAADDVGELNWEDGALIERGTFPTRDGAVPYEEVWVRAPGSDGPWQVYETADGCLVRVGDHAITAVAGDGFAACYRTRRVDVWHEEFSIGRGAGLPAPDAVDWPCVHAGEAA
jgi:hypothetical protein